MAGSEKTGVLAARPNLFQGAACVVTPTASSPPHAVGKVEELWRDVGARVLRLAPEKHDELVSRSSHLPHVLAAHLAAYVLAEGRAPEQSELCATGFRDSTRIASGSPEMWRDIALMNRTELKKALREFAAGLARFEALLDEGRPDEVQEFFQKAKSLRDGWRARCAAVSGE
jgi:prephenate dehydrogenase